MAKEVTREPATDEIDAPVDPGGAHNKGYSADPGPDNAVKESDPVPLAPGPNTHAKVRVAERDNHVQPTGRKELPDDEPIEI